MKLPTIRPADLGWFVDVYDLRALIGNGRPVRKATRVITGDVTIRFIDRCTVREALRSAQTQLRANDVMASCHFATAL